MRGIESSISFSIFSFILRSFSTCSTPSLRGTCTVPPFICSTSVVVATERLSRMQHIPQRFLTSRRVLIFELAKFIGKHSS